MISFMIYDDIVRSAKRPHQPRAVPIPVAAVDRQMMIVATAIRSAETGSDYDMDL